MFEFCAATSALGKGFQDQGLGKVVGYSETNLTLQAHLQKHFPEAEVFEDHAQVTAEALTHLKTVYFVGGFPCPEHSPANNNAKGTGVPKGRLYVEGVDAALAAYSSLGVPVLLVECTPDVTKLSRPRQPYLMCIETSVQVLLNVMASDLSTRCSN